MKAVLHQMAPGIPIIDLFADAPAGKADGRWYVGPGNGLFELVQRRAGNTRSWDIDWKPERLSASFHGRDLFAPVAAMLARTAARPAA